MPAIINATAGGELNPILDGSGGPVATAIAVVRTTSLSCSLGDALSASVSYGWDQVAGEASIVLPTQSGTIGDTVSVTMGAGLHIQRFSGTLVSFDTRAAPHSVTALCKGPLYALERWKNDQQTLSAADGSSRPGLAFEDLVNAHTATLRQIITAVLNIVGVSYTLGNLADPAHLYGVLANGRPGATDALTWGTHETASAYVHKVLQASAGYRLFDSADGNVHMAQTSAIPDGSEDFRLTLGLDIFGDSLANTTDIGRQSAVLVEGYDDGSGPATASAGSGLSAFQVSSPLIETDAFAQEIADFWLPQVNRNQQLVKLVTPRDELFGPAQTHFIYAPGGLSINEHMWLKSVTTEIDSNGAFTQRPLYIAGT